MPTTQERRKSRLQPQVLAKISNLSLRARIIVDGLVTGLHRSPIKGRDVEFAEHREYSPGDELRHIDWKVYARTGRHYVKRFEQQTNVKAQILVDCSRSMLVDTVGISKLEYARNLAACLSYLILKQGDSVGLILFDERVRSMVGAEARMEHHAPFCEALVQVEPGADTRISQSLTEIASSLRRRQMMILISDLIDDVDEVIDAVTHLKHHRHDVLVFQLLDPREISFDFQGGVKLLDLESGEALKVDADEVRELYREEAERVVNEYRSRFRQKGLDYALLQTDEDLGDALLRYLSHRHGGGQV